MGSLSALFNLSRSALTADQAALDATARNVANQNTVEYTQQVVKFASLDTVALSGQGASSSSTIATVSSARDRVLEQRLQQQTQLTADTSARADALAQVEQVFSLTANAATAGSTQVGTDLDALFSSLTALAANPADSATGAGVLSAAAALASDFNAAATQLTQVKAGLGGDIANAVPQVNALTASIASLNGQIAALSPDADAGALEDQRQGAIAKLSELVGLDQVTTENNGVTLTTQGGTVLVEGQRSFVLTAGSTAAGADIRDSSGADVSAGVVGGSLGGKLTAQNTDLPAVVQALDALAFQVATAVNAQNAAGTTQSGTPGGAIFNVPASVAGSAAAMGLAGGAQVAAAAAGEGSSGNGNANALAGLVTAIGANGLTMTGSLAALVGMVGTQSAALQEQKTTEQAMVTQLTTQRDALSGVSLDEQAANLAEYQKSYEAAAKLLTVLDALMATAINLGTPTSVS